ncbi:Hypothetical predicted protein [Olea europaea subsp. europaea]|uniref:MAR-binding filament-like protein 1-1 n=1 Tax=Olea europaea subsp. europaea TaxID=158383 RepID=A0A8S0QDC7_OLEEU|nr:Hypothetical predicted protein [Olea europaea subsp. europaea]
MFCSAKNAHAQKIRTSMACMHREKPKEASRRVISTTGFSLLGLSANHVESLAAGQSCLMFCSTKNAHAQKIRTSVACMHREKPKEASRRVISTTGFSLLGLSANHVESLAADLEIKAQGDGQGAKQSQNPFLASGIFFITLLGTLYARAIKEKASNAAIESMKNNLKKKEAAITSLVEKFDLEKEVANQQLQKASEKNKRLAYQLEQSWIDIKELDAQLNSLRAKAVRKKKEHWEKLKKILEYVAISRTRISLMGSEIQENVVKLRKLNSKLAGKKTELAKLRDEAEDLVKQMQHLKDLRLKLEAQVSTMQAELVEARHDAEVLAG